MTLNAVSLSLRSATIKIIVVAVVAAIAGATAGIASVHAEELSNQYVNGAGYVANPGTTGWHDSNGNTYAVGQSTSNSVLYYQYAGARIWHQEITPPNLLEDQDGEQWYNSTGGATRVLFGSAYGDTGVTHSYFAVQGIQGNEYYTSWPDYTGSCYNFWNSGSSC